MQNYLHYKDLENNTSNHHPNKNKNLRFGELTRFALTTQLLYH